MRSWWNARRLDRSLRRALRERQDLRARPWEEDLLHWARDGSLHGRFVPPPAGPSARGKRRSTTADGWCPGWAEQVQRQYLSDPEG